MKVTYTGKLIVGGSGIGTTAWHQVKPLYEHNYLEKVYSEGKNCDIPDELFNIIEVPQGDYLIQDLMFDSLTSLSIEKTPEIIQTWGSHCLHTLREFPESKSIVNLYSIHPIEQNLLLRQEYAQFNLQPSNSYLTKKFTKELELCDHIFIPSEFIMNSLRRHGLEHKARIVPFGVDLEKFKPAERNDSKFRVIYVGSNWIRKGLIYLLSAWKMFLTTHKTAVDDAELIVAGCQYTFKDLPSNVKIGWVDDLVKEYQNSSVFCLPAIEDGCPLCVGGNTIIPTDDGAFYITEDLIGRKAISKDGMYNTIIRKYKRKVEHYYKFKISKCLPLDTSEDHKFWATKDSRYLINKYKNPDLSWYRADELEEGDFVTIPIPKSNEEFPIIDLTNFDDSVLYNENFVWYKQGFSPDKKISYCDIAKKTNTTKKTVEALVRKLRNGKEATSEKQKIIFKYMKTINYELPEPKKYKRYIKIDDDLLWLFGWYIAEGSSHKRVKFSLGINDEPYIEKIKMIFKNKFEEELIEERPINKPSNINLYCNSKIHSLFFKKWFGDGTHHKKIPKELLLGIDKLFPLAYSLILGDAHIEDRNLTFSTTSKTLLFHLWMVLLTQKMLGSLSKQKQKYKYKGDIKTSNVYVLRLSGKSFYRFMKKVKINVNIPQRIGADEIFLEDCVMIPVRKIEKINERKTLYDIEVDKEHSFIGNGCLLHNCTYEAMACGIPVLITNTTGTYQHVFTGTHGFVIPPKDIKAIYDKLVYFYENPSESKRMGTNARKMAEAFSWERHEAGYIKFIEEI